MSALDMQIGGDHYKRFEIQPVEFIVKNGLGFIEGNIIKYVCRHEFKGGVNDLHKAMHYIDLLIELKYGDKKETQTESDTPPDELIGGNHPRRFAIQPEEFIARNGLGSIEGDIIKHVCRHEFRGGKEDLLKAKHCIDLLIELKYWDKTEGETA